MASELDEDGRAKERIPYHRYAFKNVYNYVAMGGFATAAVLNQNWWLLVLGAGLEGLWMLFGPDSRLLRKLWFDKVHAAKLEEAAERELDEKIASLPRAEAAKVARLRSKREQVLALCAENQALAGQLMRGELSKLEHLVVSFAELLVSSCRYRAYLENADVKELEAEMRKQEAAIEASEDAMARELAQKNLAVLLKRKEKLAEVRGFIERAQAQVQLIDNTFQLLADQIMTMRSPAELGGQLDDLIDGVEAVRTTARETEALLEPAR
jgi:hypothetical protein